MIAAFILEKYVHALEQLKNELSLYSNEGDIWIIKGEVKNSAGNLALHIIGNIKHFFGATLGNTGYVRQRDKEFADKNISREKLLAEIDETIAVLTKVLPAVKDEEMAKDFPIEFKGKIRPNLEMFLHLYGHLNYHLGQINYHRRLLN